MVKKEPDEPGKWKEIRDIAVPVILALSLLANIVLMAVLFSG